MTSSSPDWRILRFENAKGEYCEVGTFLGANTIPLPPGYRLVNSARMVPIDAREPRYDRAELVDVLVQHQATNTSGCVCGWGVLGASHAEHVAAMYEARRHD